MNAKPLAVALAAVASVIPGTSLAAPGLQTFVMSVGGQSNYSTFGVPQAVYDNFGAMGVSVPSNPAGLDASGVSGGYSHKTGLTAPLVAVFQSNSGNWVTTWTSSNQHSGTAAASARYGVLGATTRGTYNGWSDGATSAGSESFAVFTEELTITAPGVAAGTPGSVRFTFTLRGSMTAAGVHGTAGIESFYKLGSGPAYPLVRASVNPALGSAFYPYSGPGFDGFAKTAADIHGEGSFESGDLPFVHGQSIDLKVGLLAYQLPAKDVTGTVDFGTTLKLTGISVAGAPNAVVASGSGTHYSSGGVIAEPAPPLEVIATALETGVFRARVRGLDPTRRYVLERSATLADGFPIVVDGPRPAGTSATPDEDDFTDPAPPPDHAFYRVRLVP